MKDNRSHYLTGFELVNIKTGKITLLNGKAVEYLDGLVRNYCQDETWLFNHRLNSACFELENCGGVK